MTEHLPECPMSTKDAICCSIACICDALRTCEERVLNAAREAVAALPPLDRHGLGYRPAYLAAIDALREKQ